jgi:hypothetical protein
MLRKIIIILCVLGTAYYGTRIFQLKDNIMLKSDDTMLLKFSMDSSDAQILSACQKLFDGDSDVINILPHPTEKQKATLSVERRFSAKTLQNSLDLRKKLQALGCLKNETDVFSFAPIKKQ